MEKEREAHSEIMKGISKNKGLYHLFMIPFSFGIYLILNHFILRKYLFQIILFFKALNFPYINVYTAAATAVLLVLASLFLFSFLTGQLNKIRFDHSNLGKGMKLGWYVILYSAVYLIVSYKDFSGYQTISQILAAIIYYLLVAVTEEFVFRGLVQKNAIEYLKGKIQNSKKAAYSAILCSSLLFALAHLSNAGSVSDKAVLIQITGAFVYGILFGIITFKTGSLLSTVLLHFINDIASAYAVIIIKTGKTVADIINGYGVTELIAMIPVLFCGVWLYIHDTIYQE